MTIKYIKKYLNLKVISFLIIYIVTCVFLIYMEHFLYGGTVNTNYITFILVPIISLFQSNRFQKNHDTSSTSSSRLVHVVIVSIFIIIPVFLLYRLYRNPYNFIFYYFFILILYGVLYSIKHKEHTVITSNYTNIRILRHMYVLLLIVSVLYILILSPSTIKNAKMNLTMSHYTNVNFIGSEEDLITMNIIFKGEIASEKSRKDLLGYYIFTGILDNREQYIVVSVSQGAILHSTDITERNQELIEMAY